MLLSCVSAATAPAAAVAPAFAAGSPRGAPDDVMPGAYDGTICFAFSPPARDAQGHVYAGDCEAWIAGAHVAWRLI